MHQHDILTINDLPVEIISEIFSHIGYLEKHQLKRVCCAWKDIIDDMLQRGSTKEIQEALQLEYYNDLFYQGDPGYAWYLHPKDNAENICIQAGWKILEYAILAEDEESGFDPDNLEERSLYAISTISKNHLELKLLMALQTQFVNERVDLFNHLYGTIFTSDDVGAATAATRIA